MRYSIRKKIMLSFILLIIMLALAIIVLYAQMSGLIRLTRESWEESELLSDVVSNMRNMDRSLQKYLYAESKESLEDYAIYSDQLITNFELLQSGQFTGDSTLSVRNTRAALTQFFSSYPDLTADRLRSMGTPELLALEKNLSYTLDSAIYNSNRNATKSMMDEVARFRNLQLFSILFSLGICALAVYCALSLSHKLTEPITMLSQSMRALPDNDFHGERVAVHTEDELEKIGNIYNSMLDAIEDYIAKNSEMAEELRASVELQSQTRLMQLRTLQAQINPHFLYNTLNAGAALAIRENADDTGEFLVKVSQLFRYNLSELDTVSTLREELEHVDLYFDILNTRYSKMITYRKAVPEEYLDVLIPRMVLQPLVENSFLHGLAERKNGIIEITARAEDGLVRLEILDNGKGISPENLERINQGVDLQQKNQSSGFGLFNVITRLRLFYPEIDPIRFESEEGKYTRAVLTLSMKMQS